MIGDVLKLKDTIGRRGRYKEIEDKVGTIQEGIRTENDISRQGTSLYLQDKEGMGKIKYRDISETSIIKAELKTTISMVNNINQDHRR